MAPAYTIKGSPKRYALPAAALVAASIASIYYMRQPQYKKDADLSDAELAGLAYSMQSGRTQAGSSAEAHRENARARLHDEKDRDQGKGIVKLETNR